MAVRQIEPSWWVSLIPIVFLVAIMSVVIRIFGADALGGASQLALILSAGVGIFIAVFVCGCSLGKLESAILDNVRNIGSGNFTQTMAWKQGF